MALRDYQQAIVVSTMYEIRQAAPVKGSEQIQPSIEVVGGAVSIYGSQAATAPASPPTGMSLTVSGFQGIQPFAVLPNFLYITGSPTSIILSGVKATVVA